MNEFPAGDAMLWLMCHLVQSVYWPSIQRAPPAAVQLCGGAGFVRLKLKRLGSKSFAGTPRVVTQVVEKEHTGYLCEFSAETLQCNVKIAVFSAH